MGKQDNLSCLLRGQEVKKQPSEPDMEQWTGFKLGKEYVRLYIVTLLFNLYVDYIKRNFRLDEAQSGMKIARRNINNLRYAADTTLIAESEEELRSLLMKVKKSVKAGLKQNIKKTEIMSSSPFTSWQTDRETVETMTDFIILGSKITADGDCSHGIKMLAPWKKSYDQPRQNS